MTKEEIRETTDTCQAKVQWLWRHIIHSDSSTTLILEPVKEVSKCQLEKR